MEKVLYSTIYSVIQRFTPRFFSRKFHADFHGFSVVGGIGNGVISVVKSSS
ncbi:MAG: hypothetical protein LBK97_00945 [Prevotellaceae bacterium]|nr:hypothetical protein [Prevotellaceae bacterium]